MQQYENVFVMDHPLIQHKLTFLRDVSTGTKNFRELVSEIATLMCYEATRDLPLMDVETVTPMQKTTTKVIAGRKLAFGYQWFWSYRPLGFPRGCRQS